MTRQEIQHVMNLWEIEYKTLREVPLDKRGELFAVVESIKVNLLEYDSIHSLVEKYFGGNDWCLTIAEWHGLKHFVVKKIDEDQSLSVFGFHGCVWADYPSISSEGCFPLDNIFGRRKSSANQSTGKFTT